MSKEQTKNIFKATFSGGKSFLEKRKIKIESNIPQNFSKNHLQQSFVKNLENIKK